MCDGRGHGTPNRYLANLRQPMPLGRKLSLIARNMWLRIWKRQTCCGHYGEPGC
jgi:hypothetical protein